MKSRGESRVLGRIHVREETSKVQKDRSFYCRGGEYFERLGEIAKRTDEEALVFSIDGETMLSKRTTLYHFHKLVELAGIRDAKERGLVPYSVRHFMITQCVVSGLSFVQIADMCGTSVGQIERTYYHLNDEIRLTNALADYKRNSDGTIEPI